MTMTDVYSSGDLSQDIGTFLQTGGNTLFDETVYSESQTTTPAPEGGEFKECLLLCFYSVSWGRMALTNCDFEITFVSS